MIIYERAGDETRLSCTRARARAWKEDRKGKGRRFVELGISHADNSTELEFVNEKSSINRENALDVK